MPVLSSGIKGQGKRALVLVWAPPESLDRFDETVTNEVTHTEKSPNQTKVKLSTDLPLEERNIHISQRVSFMEPEAT